AARFRKVASIATTSMEYRIPASPQVVGRVKNNIEETLKAVNPDREEVRRTGVAAFVALVAYARANNALLGMSVRTVFLPHTQEFMVLSQVPLKGGSAWWQGSPEGTSIIGTPEPSSQPVFPVSHSTVIFSGVNFKGLGLGRAFIGTDNQS